MEFKAFGVLRQVAIKQGKPIPEGGRMAPSVIIQIEAPVSRSLEKISFFVGQSVDILISSAQLSFDEMEERREREMAL